MTVYGGELKKPKASGTPPEDLPEAEVRPLDAGPLNIAVTGVGGTGVLTIGAILGMAAHLDGKASMVLDMAGLAQKGGAVLSHIRLGQRPDDVAAPRIANGRADLLLAADDVVASGPEGISLCNIERTVAVVNTHVMPVADFVRSRDFDFKTHAVEGTIRKATREDSAFLDFAALARKVAGDTIATNIMMVGYACQLGLLPVGRAAIEDAIRLNGVAVDANLAAFTWGRAFAARPELVAETVADTDAPKLSQDDLSLDELIAHRVTHLTGYQGARLAKRYQKRIADLRTKLGDDLARAAAISYAKVLAYKDEYEVARLFREGTFQKSVADKFEGDVRIKLNLAPPMLPGKDPIGRPKKREFGPWVMSLFGLMVRFKSLRGTPVDIFGYTEERRAERRWIRTYEEIMKTAEDRHAASNPETIKALLELPQNIRGFGPVKEASMADAEVNRAALMSALDAPPEALAAE